MSQTQGWHESIYTVCTGHAYVQLSYMLGQTRYKEVGMKNIDYVIVQDDKLFCFFKEAESSIKNSG